MEQPAAVELKEIRKYFGTVKANDGVDLVAKRGEILAVLGENGSGKSTLMNILSGLYSPDGGEIRIDGKQVLMTSPKDALQKGVGMIHQHFKLAEALTAWENIVGGLKNGLFLRKKTIISRINDLCGKYHLSVDPEKKIYDMSIGEKQTVEIVKALYRGASIMILDEPTAVLTAQETRKLFDILREMRANGCAVIIITHKLQEVMDISDRVTVLRRGKSVASLLTKDARAGELAELMVGRAMDLSVPYEETEEARKVPVLEIKNLHTGAKGHAGRLDIPELTVRSCEIVGVAGIAGSGQKELCDAITGLYPAKGSIKLKGEELVGKTPRMMRNEGIQIGYVPEDRLGMGLASGRSISANAVLRSYQENKGLLLDKKAEKEKADKLIKDYQVSTTGSGAEIQTLSGGNIQKVLLGREIDRGADFFIAAYPVRGLDIGASDFIYEKLNEEKKKGVAILFIGEDLDVLLAICDRIAVLHDGRLMAVVDAKKTTKEKLGLLMMGEKEEAEDDASN